MYIGPEPVTCRRLAFRIRHNLLGRTSATLAPGLHGGLTTLSVPAGWILSMTTNVYQTVEVIPDRSETENLPKTNFEVVSLQFPVYLPLL